MKMRFLMILGVLILGCKAFSIADDNTVYSYGFSSDSKTVTLSTTPASPTKIMNRDSYIRANWVVGISSFSIYFSSFNTTISTSQTSGSFSVPSVGGSVLAPWKWTPDGPNSVYQGAMWAISQPQQTPVAISVFRSK